MPTLAAVIAWALACASPAPRVERTSLFGCWAHTTVDRENELVLCTDGAFVRSTIVYPNTRIASPPTVCAARGTVSALGSASFRFDLQQGECDNGREIAPVRLACTLRAGGEDASQRRGQELHCLHPSGLTLVFRPTKPVPSSSGSPEHDAADDSGAPDSLLRAEVYSYGRILGALGELYDENGRVLRSVPAEPEGFEATTEIPCALGEQFGAAFAVQYVQRADSLGSLTIRWEHPPIEDPAHRVTGTVTEFPGRIPPDLPLGSSFTTFAGWALDDAADLVDGDWRLVLLHRGRELAHQSFRTVGCAPSARR